MTLTNFSGHKNYRDCQSRECIAAAACWGWMIGTADPYSYTFCDIFKEILPLQEHRQGKKRFFVWATFLCSLQYSGLLPRESWDMWHPTLVAEALFAIANIFSSLRLISLFTANSHLGPLQISLGRMLLDILKFLFIYCLVLLAFANGLNQLYFYYETNEANNCKGIRCEKQNNAFST